MSKESINLLKIQLYLEYYKKDITDRYIRCIDKIVLDNDVLNNLDERMYITTLDVYNELKLVKEENFKLQARSDRYKCKLDKLKFAIKSNCIKDDNKYREICCDGDYLLSIINGDDEK